MKLFLLHILFTLYTGVAIGVLFMAIMWPLAKDLRGAPQWMPWVIYPLAVIIGLTQGRVIYFFRQTLNF